MGCNCSTVYTVSVTASGGRTGAILASLIASAKRIHVDPFTYLRDVLERIAAHPQHRLMELLPDQWAAAHNRADA